jgi:hypothetical protein
MNEERNLETGQRWSITPETYLRDPAAHPARYIDEVVVVLNEELTGGGGTTLTVGWSASEPGEPLALIIWKSFPVEALVAVIEQLSPAEVVAGLKRSPSPFSRGWAEIVELSLK